MTYAAHHRDFAPYLARTADLGSNAVAKRPGVLRRFFEAFLDARQKSADREIARQLDRSGGRLTDSIEREILQNLMTGNLKFRD